MWSKPEAVNSSNKARATGCATMCMERARIGCTTAAMQIIAKFGIAWSVSPLEPPGTTLEKRDRVQIFLSATADPASVTASAPPPCVATRLLRRQSVVVRFVQEVTKYVPSHHVKITVKKLL